MSGVLLDTHILLWWLTDDNKLPSRFHGIIADAHIPCFVSAATIWEIGIKRALGKLDAPTNLVRIVQGEGFELISITPEHAEAAAALPPHHRDPFDRMLIAQKEIGRVEPIPSHATRKKPRRGGAFRSASMPG